MFQNSADIANRALQHCGVPRMDATLGFTEGTERANELNFAYGKVKRAEFEDNVWTFATRRAALRPIDTNTMVVNPAMWMSTATYFRGSIVSDSTGFLWISRVPNNLNNQPGQPSAIFAWEPYFGPLTAALYDSTTAYRTGEIVYTAPGDGTYNTYLSLSDQNALDPSLPNQWSNTAIYSQNQVVQQYPAWNSGTNYAQWSAVTYTDGITYVSINSGNTNNIPSASTGFWAVVPTLTLTPQSGSPQSSPVLEWNSGTTYSFASAVMFEALLYVSVINNNTGNNPANSGQWSLISGGTLYMSLINLNTGNNPSNVPALWASGTTYSTGNKVGGSDGVIYTSVGNGNVGHDPTTDGGVHWTNTGVLLPWTTVFTQGGGNSQWLQIGGASFPAGVALTVLNIIYPIGAGPFSDSSSKNVFRLPAGYLRLADQNPKSGVVSWLGVPGNPPQLDWTFEGNYFVSWEAFPIVFRFVADMVDVTQFPSTFCEALAARLGMEMAPIWAPSKVDQIAKEYLRWIGIATMKSGIEKGAVMPPLDDLIACRA